MYEQIWNVYEPFTTRERLQESLHPVDTQQNEAMNAFVSKYAPKTKIYGMTISLTNSVMIFVGIGNLTAEKYWGQGYLTLDLTMATETTFFLKSQVTSWSYKKMHQARADIKSKRAKDNNNKIK